MNDTPLNDYRNLMDGLELPDRVRTSVMRKATQPARAHTSTAPRPVRTPPRRRIRWGLAAAACLAVVVGIGMLAAVPLDAMLRGINGTTPFGLTIADAAETGESVALAPDDSGIKPAGTGGFYMRFQMNLTCTGENIRHLTYTIEGKDISFMAFDWTQGADHPDMSVPEQFEVDYTDQNPEGIRREILVDMADPAMKELDEQEYMLSQQIDASDDPDEIAQLEAQRQELERQRTELHNAYYEPIMSGEVDDNTWYANLTTQAAEKLANATLSVTATFADGTTATKRYRIAPVDDFYQTIFAYEEASMNPNHDENDPRLTAPLFTITEIEAA